MYYRNLNNLTLVFEGLFQLKLGIFVVDTWILVSLLEVPFEDKGRSINSDSRLYLTYAKH